MNNSCLIGIGAEVEVARRATDHHGVADLTGVTSHTGMIVIAIVAVVVLGVENAIRKGKNQEAGFVCPLNSACSHVLWDRSPTPEAEILLRQQQRELEEITRDARTVFIGQLQARAVQKDVKKFFETVCKVVQSLYTCCV